MYEVATSIVKPMFACVYYLNLINQKQSRLGVEGIVGQI